MTKTGKIIMYVTRRVFSSSEREFSKIAPLPQLKKFTLVILSFFFSNFCKKLTSKLNSIFLDSAKNYQPH